MIGTQLVEELVQATALSHLVKGFPRVSLLLLAAPESGKTTITAAAKCKHVLSIAVISGRSVLKEIKTQPETEYLLFNDLSSIRALSFAATNLLIVLLNQLTQDERGLVGFAGKDAEHIERCAGLIGCLPFELFTDHRSKWKQVGFVSRMIPFAYSYSEDLIARIKNGIDLGHGQQEKRATSKMPKARRHEIHVSVSNFFIEEIRSLADAKAVELGETGIRLLNNYHALVRAHAILKGWKTVKRENMRFLRAVNKFVSITHCRPLTLDKHLKGE